MAWTVGDGLPTFAGAAAAQSVPTDIGGVLASLSSIDELQGSPILALSDGHGGSSYDRSDVGSAIAVGLAAVIAGSIGRDVIAGATPSSAWTTELPRRIVQQWRRVVLDDQNALDAPADAMEHVTRYGATVLGAAIGDDAGLFFQLGDGDLVIVDTDLKVHRPTPAVTDMFGSETESLCQEDAEYKVRLTRQVRPAKEILMVMLSSDGVSNSFVDDSGFEGFVRDVAERSTTMSREMLRAQLFRWIASCTKFSGDDVSMALAVRQTGHANE